MRNGFYGSSALVCWFLFLWPCLRAVWTVCFRIRSGGGMIPGGLFALCFAGGAFSQLDNAMFLFMPLRGIAPEGTCDVTRQIPLIALMKLW
jgi:hypothetical protein